MPAAARVTDTHACTMVDPGPKPHAPPPGPIAPPCSTTVLTDNLAQARATDQLTCATPPPNFIVTGAQSVLVDGQMAARATDKTMHPPPGSINPPCSPDVEIGGPTGGATLGNPKAGNAACTAAAAGRNPAPGTSPIPARTTAQNYNNCGVESSRQIINRANGTQGTPAAISQETLLTLAIATGQATNVPGNLFQSGGGNPSNRVNILANNGVPAQQVAPTMPNLQQAVAERRGVMSDVWAAQLWTPAQARGARLVPGTNTGGHTVLVTGVQYDQFGNPQFVIINDTGVGNCSQAVPAAQFQASLIGGGNNHVVTNNPIW